jgi:hypothetical protein
LVVFSHFFTIDCVDDSVKDGQEFFLNDGSLHFGEHDFQDEKDDTGGFGLGGDVRVEVVDFLEDSGFEDLGDNPVQFSLCVAVAGTAHHLVLALVWLFSLNGIEINDKNFLQVPEREVEEGEYVGVFEDAEIVFDKLFDKMFVLPALVIDGDLHHDLEHLLDSTPITAHLKHAIHQPDQPALLNIKLSGLKVIQRQVINDQQAVIDSILEHELDLLVRLIGLHAREEISVFDDVGDAAHELVGGGGGLDVGDVDEDAGCEVLAFGVVVEGREVGQDAGGNVGGCYCLHAQLYLRKGSDQS